MHSSISPPYQMLSSDYTARCHKQMLPICFISFSPDLAGLSLTHVSSKVSSNSLICIFLTLFFPQHLLQFYYIFSGSRREEQHVAFMMVASLSTYIIKFSFYMVFNFFYREFLTCFYLLVTAELTVQEGVSLNSFDIM